MLGEVHPQRAEKIQSEVGTHSETTHIASGKEVAVFPQLAASAEANEGIHPRFGSRQRIIGNPVFDLLFNGLGQFRLDLGKFALQFPPDASPCLCHSLRRPGPGCFQFGIDLGVDVISQDVPDRSTPRDAGSIARIAGAHTLVDQVADAIADVIDPLGDPAFQVIDSFGLQVGRLVGEAVHQSREPPGYFVPSCRRGPVHDAGAEVFAHGSRSGGIDGQGKLGIQVDHAGSGDELDPSAVIFKKPVGEGAFGKNLFETDRDIREQRSRRAAPNGSLQIQPIDDEAQFALAGFDRARPDHVQICEQITEAG